MATQNTFLALIALLLVVSPVFAWEEQLEGCRLRGIAERDCPDDESFVGVPVEEKEASERRSNRIANTRSRWAVDTWSGDDTRVCYTAHYQLIFERRTGMEVIDFPERTVYACTSTYPVINTVLTALSERIGAE